MSPGAANVVAPSGTCPLCGGASSRWLVKNDLPIQRCDVCDNRFLAPADIPADLESLYSAEYFTGGVATGYPTYQQDAPMLERNFAERVRRIAAWHAPGRILDVGAAYGYFVKAARAAGWDASGVELAPEVAREAAKLAGAEIIAGDFLEVALAPGFDVITMFDVIEHVRDPLAWLVRARELLAPGGLLVIETGDVASAWARLLGRHWYFLDPPQHLFYFTGAGLEALLARAGFRAPLQRWRSGRWVSLANIAFKLVRLAPPSRARSAVIEFAQTKLGGSLYLRFGDTLLLAAAKDAA
jgi:SAM-dependent methyltransferase